MPRPRLNGIMTVELASIRTGVSASMAEILKERREAIDSMSQEAEHNLWAIAENKPIQLSMPQCLRLRMATQRGAFDVCMFSHDISEYTTMSTSRDGDRPNGVRSSAHVH